jgi:SAM-dependent methyltransferase
VIEKQPWLELNTAQLFALMRAPIGGLERGVDHPSRRKLRELLRPGESVLDIGCQTGVEYQGLSEHGPPVRYTGVELSPAAVQLAQKYFPDATFLVGDVQQGLDLDDQSFDTVFCRHLLEHLSDIDRAIPEMLRLARQRIIMVFFLAPRDLDGAEKVDLQYEGEDVYNHVYDWGYLNRLLAPCERVSVYSGLGGTPVSPDEENVIVEAWVRDA